MRLIDTDLLEIETQSLEDVGQGEIQFYSVEQIDNAPTVEAMSKIIPRHVIYSGDGYADGSIVYDMAECPNCGYKYEELDHDWEMPYCPNCGCSLLWEMEGEINDGKC